MYNPSRGGVRGGADQFTWESVKSDKHRENYLGHSLKAPVGRWQKGKDLSWYAKERKDADVSNNDKSELASIKRAEEEAMLIALGHNVVKKETQKISKKEMREVLKRNTGERDDHNIERIDGVGATNKRLALLSNAGNNFKQNHEGVVFEGYKDKQFDESDRSRKIDISRGERKKNKKLKKHKKEKKHKKHQKELSDSDSSENTSKHRTQYKESESDSDCRKSSKVGHHKKSKHKHKEYSSDDSRAKPHSSHRQKDKKRHKRESDSGVVKRHRHESLKCY